MLYLSHYASPLGELLLAAREKTLVGVWFLGQAHFPAQFSEPTVTQQTSVLEQTARWLDRYFDGEAPNGAELPLAPEGSNFSKRVWEQLQQIPYGQTVTYGDIARVLSAEQDGKRASARAVGGAVGRNPISICIPCHRVLGGSHRLTGYAGGVARKAALLTLEQAKTPDGAKTTWISE